MKKQMKESIKNSIMVFIIFLVFSALVVVVIVGVSTNLNIASKVNAFEALLEEQGFTVENGIIQSPSVIIELSKEEFLVKATELQSTIYKYLGEFYVFEENMLIAYKHGP